MRQVVGAVRQRRAAGMFPPVIREGPEHTVVVVRDLGGDVDARRIAAVLADPAFAPVAGMLDRLHDWAVAAADRYAGTVAPDVLRVGNAELFGPTVCAAFAVCAGGATDAVRVVDDLGARCVAFLDLFLTRLHRDVRADWPDRSEWRGEVTALWCHDEETHNGRQRVLRLDFAGGGRLAYKPRPASGERVFLAERGSVFARLNDLPAASGPVRLPTLACWTGDGGYWWQEWVDAPNRQGVLRADGDVVMRGTVLPVDDAARFWRRAGNLAAACFAFGVTDLHGGNVPVGARSGGEPLYYPVDVEVYLAPMRRLAATGLTHDATTAADHHVGFEDEARWCSAEGARDVWVEEPDGVLRLWHRDLPFLRQHTRSVVGDTEGRTGYAGYLPALLRGMFDAWTLMCRNRGALGDLLDELLASATVRVLLRPTTAYVRALDDAGSLDGFLPAERDQMRRQDVPYFLSAATGGPLLQLRPPPADDVTEPAGVERDQVAPDCVWPPDAAVRACGQLELSRLGVALRDAVDYVFDDVAVLDAVDRAHGVRLRLYTPQDGEVAFDWVEVGRRITFSWDAARTRLRVDPLDGPDEPMPVPRGAEIRERLLRLDRVDSALRPGWAAGDFTDEAVGDRLRRLTEAGAGWLRSVVDEHGWPGRSMVGRDAAATALRLVQHHDDLPFQEHCLELVERAVHAGEVPRRELAYLVDTVRVGQRRPQVYGTKFRKEDGGFVPYPIEAAEGVERRRKEMGLDTLDDYAVRLRERFAGGPDGR